MLELPAELRALVGQEAEPQEFVVEAGAVRKFREATMDPCPEDEVPPTFPTSFRLKFPDYRSMFNRILHAEQEYVYHRPLRIGQRVRCTGKIRDIYRKEGRSGLLTFIVTEVQGRDESGELLYEATATVTGQ